MFLETDRLILKPLSNEFFDSFKVMDMDPEVMNFIRKASLIEDEAMKNFKKLLTYNESYPGLGAFACIEKASGEMIGMGVLIHIELNPENDKYEVGYRLMKSAWGKGYATEIAKELIRYGLKDLNLTEIFGTTHPDHVVSQKTLMKAGLKYIGTAPYYNGSKLFRT